MNAIEELQASEDWIDRGRYPIDNPTSDLYKARVAESRKALQSSGCSVLRGFLTSSAVASLQKESDALADKAHRRTIYTNPYSSPDDESLPSDHPVRTFQERNNAFVAADFIPDGSLLKRVYTSPDFQRFLAACLGVERIYEYDDPYAKLVLNVLEPGTQHPWHYDTNEFIVSTLIHRADAGGDFEYCPNIRSQESENYEEVSAVLRGKDDSRITSLSLEPGDLQLFHGRYSLHRVSRIRGSKPRVTGILAYALVPGVIGGVERTTRLFGRVDAAHVAAEHSRVRADGLRD